MDLEKYKDAIQRDVEFQRRKEFSVHIFVTVSTTLNSDPKDKIKEAFEKCFGKEIF